MLKLSKTTKMPCPSFALPAGDKCLTGRKLVSIPGSVCKSCYARKGPSVFPNSLSVRTENWNITTAALRHKGKRKRWVETLVHLIEGSGTGWFRWHDSGDLLSANHLRMICEVAEKTPTIKHWLPTREYRFVEMVTKVQKLPSNLTVRLSAHMVGQTLTHTLPTSSVGAEAGHKCMATYDKEATDGKCGTCRACWDRGVDNIDYKRH